jgi:hypothetical protein
MIPQVGIPQVQTNATVVAANPATANPSEASLGHLPQLSVPPTLKVPEGQNNSRGNTQYSRSDDKQEGNAHHEEVHQLDSLFFPPVSYAAPHGYSSPFLAQLMGQDVLEENEQYIQFFNGEEAILTNEEPAEVVKSSPAKPIQEEEIADSLFDYVPAEQATTNDFHDLPLFTPKAMKRLDELPTVQLDGKVIAVANTSVGDVKVQNDNRVDALNAKLLEPTQTMLEQPVQPGYVYQGNLVTANGVDAYALAYTRNLAIGNSGLPGQVDLAM